ncbi:MAG: cob(I)yrinic acid a,c-diamide adenosyltransferase [Gemmatimonadales bacterium]|jgi:cob(I)alamin adenosyltransferase
MKIYTRTGDEGETSLFGGQRVPKSAARVDAYGHVDELNAALGSALAADPQEFERELLQDIQRDLFAIGGRLASPEPDRVAKALEKAVVPHERIDALEAAIDRVEEELPPLNQFILPGGCAKAASLHLARTVCRRAERGVVALSLETAVSGEILKYLNRLSDLLFTLARLANHRSDMPDETW